MGSLNTTLVVQFDDQTGEDDGFLSAEIDSRENGLNNGDTSFEPGDPVHFLVFINNLTTIDQILPSAGSIYPAGSFNIDVEEYVTFARTKNASASKPIIGPLSVTWFGNSLGNVSVGNDGVTLIAANEGVAVARLNYSAKAHAYRLSSPLSLGGETKFSVAIVIIGKV